jgi:hypothetical protein
MPARSVALMFRHLRSIFGGFNELEGMGLAMHSTRVRLGKRWGELPNGVFGHRRTKLSDGLARTRIKLNNGSSAAIVISLIVTGWLAVGGMLYVVLVEDGVVPRLPRVVTYLYWMFAIGLALRNLWVITRRTRH